MVNLAIVPMDLFDLENFGFKCALLKLAKQIDIPSPISYGLPSCELDNLLSQKFGGKTVHSFMSEHYYDVNLAERIQDYIKGLHIEIDGVQFNYEEGFIVRSSEIIDEELAPAVSGAFESYSSEQYADIIKCLKNVWISTFSKKAYDQNRLIEQVKRTKGMAVLIQPLIKAKFSGVAQSVQDYLGFNLCYKVMATEGHLSAIVSGTASGTELYLIPEIEPIGASLISQEYEIKYARDRRQLSMYHELLRYLEKIVAIYGPNIEVEWIFDGSRLWIVQIQKSIAIETEKD